MSPMRDAPALYLGFIALHLLLGHFGSSLVYRLRFGRSPRAYARRGADGPHTRATRRVAVASLAWFFAMTAAAVSDAWNISPIGRPLVLLPPALGWAIGLVGLLGMLAAQLGMGAAFRIGVDADEAPALHEGGLHRLSRNPIYMFSFLYLVGATLWSPSLAGLAALAWLGGGIHRLVLLEEAFLRARCGERYADYCRRVPRYL